MKFRVGWEKWVRAMLEKEEKVKIVVTGSSSKIMSVDPVLTGRYVDVRVYPLSFGEFLNFRKVPTAHLDIKTNEMENQLVEYLEYGGFPTAALTADAAMRKEYLKELFDSIITKDIIARYGIRRNFELKTIVYLLLQNVSAMTSVPKITNTLKSMGIKISSTTINQYLHYLEETLLFHYVPIFSYKVKDRMQYPRKVYCTDTGLVNAILRISWGRLAENMVATELFRRHADIFYWKDKYEVDFVIAEEGSPRKLIQVVWEMDKKETREREIRAILQAMEALQMEGALMLTKSTEEKIEIDGKNKKIEVIPLWKWLLGPYPE